MNPALLRSVLLGYLAKQMSILLVGVNHKTAPVEIRERLAFNDEACAEGLRRLVDGEIVREGLIVSTCNRVEILSATSSELIEFGAGQLTQLSRHDRPLARRVFSTSISIAIQTKTPCVTCFALLRHSIQWWSASRRFWARCVMHTHSQSKREPRVEFSIDWSIIRFVSPNESELKPGSRPMQSRSVTWPLNSERRSLTRSRAAP